MIGIVAVNDLDLTGLSALKAGISMEIKRSYYYKESAENLCACLCSSAVRRPPFRAVLGSSAAEDIMFQHILYISLQHWLAHLKTHVCTAAALLRVTSVTCRGKRRGHKRNNQMTALVHGAVSFFSSFLCRGYIQI